MLYSIGRSCDSFLKIHEYRKKKNPEKMKIILGRFEQSTCQQTSRKLKRALSFSICYAQKWTSNLTTLVTQWPGQTVYWLMYLVMFSAAQTCTSLRQHSINGGLGIEKAAMIKLPNYRCDDQQIECWKWHLHLCLYECCGSNVCL